MDMRIRFNELLRESGLTPYRVFTDSDGRISASKVYRLKKLNGRLPTYTNAMLDALCDVFGVEPGDLWERDKKPGSRAPTRGTR